MNPHEPAARDKYGRSEYPKRSSSRNCPRLSAAIREEYGDGFVLFGVKSMRYAERVSRAKGGLVAAMLHAGTAMALTASAMVASAQTFTDVTTMAFGDLSDSAGGLVRLYTFVGSRYCRLAQCCPAVRPDCGSENL